MPEIGTARHYDVQLIDLYTDNYGYTGSRATGNGAGCYLVIYRTQLFNPADMDNVRTVQAGYTLRPLSAFLGKPAPPAAPPIDWLKFEAEAFTTCFPEYLNFLLQFSPPTGTAAVEQPLRERLATIGIGVDQSVQAKTLSPEVKAALSEGVKAAFARIATGKTVRATCRLKGSVSSPLGAMNQVSGGHQTVGHPGAHNLSLQKATITIICTSPAWLTLCQMCAIIPTAVLLRLLLTTS
jgi:hypothetical protein